jgi:hypothetical protein
MLAANYSSSRRGAIISESHPACGQRLDLLSRRIHIEGAPDDPAAPFRSM